MAARKGKRERKNGGTTESQARVWLNTVLAPMARLLEEEESRARERRWSYDARRDGFESLAYVRHMVQPAFTPNLLQFMRRYPAVERQAEAHDAGVTSLRDACRAAFRAVRAHPRFIEAVGDVQERDRDYFAEYIVNETPPLSESFYSTRTS